MQGEQRVLNSDLEPESILQLQSGAVRLLDQTRLPSEVVYRTLIRWQDVADAIRTMVVRGAPAIGIAGAMGVALAAATAPEELDQAIRSLRAARPTAVNLAWAVDRQARRAREHRGPGLAEALAEGAREIHSVEVARCKAIGAHGATLITRGARILTHCNAGALATGGYGTALGVVRAAFEIDPTLRVLVDETRPLLQGSRLTAWELARAGIAHRVIADNMAAAMMAAGRVSHVIVGADRIAANGDVVNKIGTYGVAVLARAHDIPFIVAAPTSTVDLATPTGMATPIEERDPAEVRDVSLLGGSAYAPDSPVANPAFDVTPAWMVNAIVTENGVHRAPYNRSLHPAGPM